MLRSRLSLLIFLMKKSLTLSSLPQLGVKGKPHFHRQTYRFDKGSKRNGDQDLSRWRM